MILSFTGTQRGMTRRQMDLVIAIVETYNPKKVVHGGCIGADADFHELCLSLGVGIIEVWPSDVPDKVAKLRLGNDITTVIIHEPQRPLLRNLDIVAGSDHLIACPAQEDEILRSGTWATVRLSTRYDIPCTVIKPTDAPTADERRLG
jgi:hypothetical protein